MVGKTILNSKFTLSRDAIDELSAVAVSEHLDVSAVIERAIFGGIEYIDTLPPCLEKEIVRMIAEDSLLSIPYPTTFEVNDNVVRIQRTLTREQFGSELNG